MRGSYFGVIFCSVVLCCTFLPGRALAQEENRQPIIRECESPSEEIQARYDQLKKMIDEMKRGERALASSQEALETTKRAIANLQLSIEDVKASGQDKTGYYAVLEKLEARKVEQIEAFILLKARYGMTPDQIEAELDHLKNKKQKMATQYCLGVDQWDSLNERLKEQRIFIYEIWNAQISEREISFNGHGRAIVDNGSGLFWGMNKKDMTNVETKLKLDDGPDSKYCRQAIKAGQIPEGQILRLVGKGEFRGKGKLGGFFDLKSLSDCHLIDAEEVDEELRNMHKDM